MNDIPYSWGTAVNVQSMVFGNMGETSGTGVAFTRNPATGEKKLYGEFLMNAQGEDVVAGIRTPQPIAAAGRAVMPEVYEQFVDICQHASRSTTAICRTWSSPSRTASSICSRPVTASVPLRQRSRSHVDLVDEGVLHRRSRLF